MVSTKFFPCGPNSHAVRTIALRPPAAAMACSPASLERPYAPCGPVGASSGYGSVAVPSNT